MIHRVLYVSQVAAPNLREAVEDILLQSVANNRRDGITGLLVCDGLTFAQALEGPPDAVDACFTRILWDDRHAGLTVRDRSTAPERKFARWSMCALYLSDLEDALLGPGDIEFELEALAAPALWQHLAGLAERHGPQLDAAHERLMAGIAG